MTFPDIQRLVLPLLRLFSDGQEHILDEVVESLAMHFQLSDIDLKEISSKGNQTKLRERVTKTTSLLERAHFIENTRQGAYRITDLGLQELRTNPQEIDVDVLEQLAQRRDNHWARIIELDESLDEENEGAGFNRANQNRFEANITREEFIQVEEQEYKDFLTYLVNEYITHPGKFTRNDAGLAEYRFGVNRALNKIKYSMGIVRYVKNFIENDSDIYRVFKEEALRETYEGIIEGIRFGSNLAKGSGMLQLVDDYFEEIIAGMRVDHFPQEDLEILRELGNKNPRQALAATVYLIRANRKRLSAQFQEYPISARIDTASEVVAQHSPTRRWFKSLGQMGEGAALLILNVGLALDFFAFAVSPETKTWGAVISATGGITKILNGVGELRGE